MTLHSKGMLVNVYQLALPEGKMYTGHPFKFNLQYQHFLHYFLKSKQSTKQYIKPWFVAFADFWSVNTYTEKFNNHPLEPVWAISSTPRSVFPDLRQIVKLSRTSSERQSLWKDLNSCHVKVGYERGILNCRTGGLGAMTATSICLKGWLIIGGVHLSSMTLQGRTRNNSWKLLSSKFIEGKAS